MKPVELTVVDTNTATWELFPLAYIGANLERVPMMSDPETGMMVLKMVYRAGFTNPWHSHPCAHGVYVLEGLEDHLELDRDRNRGPRHPAGHPAQHGRACGLHDHRSRGIARIDGVSPCGCDQRHPRRGR
jgi:hypothetical protein